jgi:hypothetical protein
MTKNFSKISIGAIILAASSAALANGNNLQPTASYANQGFLFGIDAGIGASLTPSTQYSLANGVKFGYDFKVAPDLLVGLESGIKSFNQHNTHAYGQDAIDLLLTTHYYLYKGFNIFGKAGAAFVISDVYSDKQHYKIEPEFGLGVGYTFLKNFDAHIALTSTLGTNDSKKNNMDYKNYLSNSKVYASGAVMLGFSVKI